MAHQRSYSLADLQVVPVLRAGLVLLEAAQTVLPASETYHVGYVRNDETLQVGLNRSARLLWHLTGLLPA